MSAYNTVTAELACPRCGAVSQVHCQFKFGHTRQLRYRLGDTLQWGGNDHGKPGQHHVVVDGCVEGPCPACRHDGDWDVYVHVKENVIHGVEKDDGRFLRALIEKGYAELE